MPPNYDVWARMRASTTPEMDAWAVQLGPDGAYEELGKLRESAGSFTPEEWTRFSALMLYLSARHELKLQGDCIVDGPAVDVAEVLARQASPGQIVEALGLPAEDLSERLQPLLDRWEAGAVLSDEESAEFGALLSAFRTRSAGEFEKSGGDEPEDGYEGSE